MNICKNCKVKLGKYHTVCPLCHKKVQSEDLNDTNPYGSEIENFSTRVNIIYFSKLIIELLVLSSVITMVCNLAINGRISWSLYVIFSSIYICSYYLYFIFKNKMISFSINMLCLELLLFVIAYLTNGLRWFLCLVGPFILLMYLFIILNYGLSKMKNVIRNFAYLLLYVAFSLSIINGLIILFNTNNFVITWSIYSNIPLIIVSLIFVGLSFNKNVLNEFEKRFFI